MSPFFFNGPTQMPRCRGWAEFPTNGNGLFAETVFASAFGRFLDRRVFSQIPTGSTTATPYRTDKFFPSGLERGLISVVRSPRKMNCPVYLFALLDPGSSIHWTVMKSLSTNSCKKWDR